MIANLAQQGAGNQDHLSIVLVNREATGQLADRSIGLCQRRLKRRAFRGAGGGECRRASSLRLEDGQLRLLLVLNRAGLGKQPVNWAHSQSPARLKVARLIADIPAPSLAAIPDLEPSMSMLGNTAVKKSICGNEAFKKKPAAQAASEYHWNSRSHYNQKSRNSTDQWHSGYRLRSRRT
jgi:hypothetical protein